MHHAFTLVKHKWVSLVRHVRTHVYAHVYVRVDTHVGTRTQPRIEARVPTSRYTRIYTLVYTQKPCGPDMTTTASWGGSAKISSAHRQERACKRKSSSGVSHGLRRGVVGSSDPYQTTGGLISEPSRDMESQKRQGIRAGPASTPPPPTCYACTADTSTCMGSREFHEAASRAGGLSERGVSTSDL